MESKVTTDIQQLAEGGWPASLAKLPTQIQLIIRRFVEEYMQNPLVNGALLTGSYASGVKVSKYSDIDLTFVLENAAQKQKRGNKLVDGYLVEYTACPFRYIRQLFEENRKAGIRHIARKYATGIILVDRGGIEDLQSEASRILCEPITNNASDKYWVEMAKYYLFDQLLNIRALWEENSPGFYFAYFAHVQKALDSYGKFVGIEVLRPERIHQFLSDQEFCRLYGINQFSDQEFMNLVVTCMDHVAINNLVKLNTYVIEKMGGFITDGWLLEDDC